MPWADASYHYKKKITIYASKVAGDEVDFPVLVNPTDLDLADTANGGHVESSKGYDIVFYHANENTKLYHEIDEYAAATGELIYWVNIPNLSSTIDTVFYMYYGRKGVTTDPSSTSTWNAGYKMVQHMKDDTTSTVLDSTSNNNDGAKKAANQPQETAAGKIGDAQDFDGINDYIYRATFVGYSGTMTIEFWIKMQSRSAGYDMLFGCGGWDCCCMYFDEWVYDFNIKYSAECGGVAADVYAWTLDTDWHYLCLVHNGADTRLYVDSTLRKTITPLVGNVVYCDSTLYIGNSGTGATPDDKCIDGILDEWRYSNTPRSANWQDTTHETQNDPGGFMKYGKEKTIFQFKPILHLDPGPHLISRASFYPRMIL